MVLEVFRSSQCLTAMYCMFAAMVLIEDLPKSVRSGRYNDLTSAWVFVQFPRNKDLKKEIAFLKQMGDAYGNSRPKFSLPMESIHIHGEAFRIAQRFFAEARVF